MKKINIKNLNPKEIYRWPFAAQCLAGVILGIVILIIGILFFIMDQYSELGDAKDKEEKLKLEFVDKSKQAVNLPLYKQQLVEITQASDVLLKQLPNRSEVEKLLIDINQAGIGRGLQFELFKPNAEKTSEYYVELPISIKLNGTYDAIGNFAADVSQLSRVVIIKDMNITNNNSGTLTMSATAQTFRYLDQEEIEKQKAEKRALMKKNKAGGNNEQK